MSKTNTDAQLQNEFQNEGQNPAEGNPAENNTPPDPSSEEKNEAARKPTIEDLAVKMKISKPVFTAVMMTQKWAAGKVVSEADFKQAVKDFLDAPIDGRKPDKTASENEEKK